MENYGECELKRVRKIDEREDNFEADYQAFSKEYDEKDESHRKFMALFPFKDDLIDVSGPTKEKAGFNFPMKGKYLLTKLCICTFITCICIHICEVVQIFLSPFIFM